MKVDLYKGDCLEIMDKLIGGGYEHKIDAIICDPPYGTTACKWDSVIPFDRMWEKLDRLIKDNGVVCLFGSEPFSSYLRLSNIKNYKYDWMWEKDTGIGFQHSKNMPLKRHETISVFSKAPMGHKSLLGDRRMEYNPQGVICDNAIKRVGKKSSLLGDRPNQEGKEYISYSNFPTSILKFNNNDKDKFHPTQKPIALMQYLIKTYTQENETVLDFTMGSGSTGVACVSTNRNFIGIELDKGYFDIAKKRIDDANTSIFDL